jgi:CheY-like chemotaxis protein
MSANSIRILVVDDNPATRYATAHVQRSVGWTVLEAETGKEAITKAAEGIDLVMLDVNLPDFDGFEVCRRIRAVDRLSRLPVIHRA